VFAGCNDNELLGLVTLRAAEKIIKPGAPEAPVSTILEREFPHIHPDHPLELALERLKLSHGLLPVLDRKEVNRLEGVITPISVARFVDSKKDLGI
jgi:CBS domain-containing protein